MERVTGIGGFFWRAEDPEALQRWYADNLGIDEVPWQQEAGPTAFEAMPHDAEFLGPARHWAINFRVNDLDAMVEQLRASGTVVEVDPEPYPYGRFADLRDPEGNHVQLWEPSEP